MWIWNVSEFILSKLILRRILLIMFTFLACSLKVFKHVSYSSLYWEVCWWDAEMESISCIFCYTLSVSLAPRKIGSESWIFCLTKHYMDGSKCCEGINVCCTEEMPKLLVSEITRMFSLKARSFYSLDILEKKIYHCLQNY